LLSNERTSSKSAASWALLLLAAVVAAILGKNAALANKDDVLSTIYQDTHQRLHQTFLTPSKNTFFYHSI
tara:strand:- start:917 stop:1126 length:210 start_codon:yes stop_codon:yes gene_type:complete